MSKPPRAKVDSEEDSAGRPVTLQIELTQDQLRQVKAFAKYKCRTTVNNLILTLLRDAILEQAAAEAAAEAAGTRRLEEWWNALSPYMPNETISTAEAIALYAADLAAGTVKRDDATVGGPLDHDHKDVSGVA